MLTTRRLTAAVALYWVAFFGIMHTPPSAFPAHRIPHWDKVIHCSGYAILTLLWAATAMRRGLHLGLRWFATWAGVFAAYAALDEITQPLVNRTADVNDWMADMGGVCAAMLIVAFLQRHARRPAVDETCADGVEGP